MTQLKRWKLKTASPEVSKKIAKTLNISPITAQVILNRGINSITESKKFLGKVEDTSQFPEDQLLIVKTLIDYCILSKRPILLYGDFDVDGMTSTTMMTKCLTTLGATVRYKIPHRFHDGYGLNTSIINFINEENVGLLITLDCGVTNFKEISEIKKQTDIDIIVIDHHKIPDEKADYDAMLNPQTLPKTHQLHHLCTAGIIYKFVEYCSIDYQKLNLQEYIDLAALGTVADVAKLTGGNKQIVRKGILQLSKQKNTGIKALLQAAKWKNNIVSVRDCGFTIAPRLNASGRLTSAQKGVELLLSQTAEKANSIALHLEDLNIQRRELDQTTFNECVEQIETYPQQKKLPITICGSPNWHPGIIGITASKLAATYQKPAIVVALDKTIARGSARTFGNISIYDILNMVKPHFTKFGGHKEAAGFSLNTKGYDLFKSECEEKAKQIINPNDLIETIEIDMMIPLKDISTSLSQELDQCGPFGQGNPEPLFFTNQLICVEAKCVGNGKHLKMILSTSDKKQIFDAIGFNLANKLEYTYKKELNLIFSIELNTWNSKTNVQLSIKDIK